jgi:haloalkane dehalogenase
MIDGFLAALGIEQTGLVVHDLGGPVGLYWMTRDLSRVTELVLLNTLVYPKFSWAVAAFVAASRLPGVRGLLASPKGLAWTMKLGMKTAPSADVVQAVQAPFVEKSARTILLRSASALHPKGFFEIAKALPAFTGPVRAIYGTQDRILPDVAKTMARVAKELPQTEVTPLDGCGHFLQEDRPDELGALLAAFFAQH